MKKVIIGASLVVLLLGVILGVNKVKGTSFTEGVNNELEQGITKDTIKDEKKSKDKSSDNIKNIDYVDNFDQFAYCCALETFFSDENYDYMFSSMISQYIEVEYKDGSKENVTKALKNGHIKINDLNRFGINYMKQVKTAY